MTTSKAPIARLPIASYAVSPVISAAVIATERDGQSPMSAAKSSSRTIGSSGVFAVRMNRHQPTLPFTWRVERTAVRNENSSSTIAPSRMPIAQPTDSSSCGFRSFSMPSKIENRPADREQQHRHDEGPEVALASVAERMLDVGHALRLVPAEEQQTFVAGVGDRVDGLREHRARPGEREADELHDRDAEIGGERGDHCGGGVFVSRHRAACYGRTSAGGDERVEQSLLHRIIAGGRFGMPLHRRRPSPRAARILRARRRRTTRWRSPSVRARRSA